MRKFFKLISVTLVLAILFTTFLIPSYANSGSLQPVNGTIISTDEFRDSTGSNIKIVVKNSTNDIYYVEQYTDGRLDQLAEINKESQIVKSTIGDDTTTYNIADEVIINNAEVTGDSPEIVTAAETIYDESTDLTYTKYTTANYPDLYIWGTDKQTQQVKIYLNKDIGVGQYTVNAKGKTCLTIAALLIGALPLPALQAGKLANYLLAVVFGGVVAKVTDTINEALFPTFACNYDKSYWLGIGSVTQYRIYGHGAKYVITETGSSKQGMTYYDEEDFYVGKFSLSNEVIKMWVGNAYS